MVDFKCPIIERDEGKIVDDKDVRFINNERKKEFAFWCREKLD